MKPTNGVCCNCNCSGEEQTYCPASPLHHHCVHWFEGPDGDNYKIPEEMKVMPKLPSVSIAAELELLATKVQSELDRLKRSSNCIYADGDSVFMKSCPVRKD